MHESLGQDMSLCSVFLFIALLCVLVWTVRFVCSLLVSFSWLSQGHFLCHRVPRLLVYKINHAGFIILCNIACWSYGIYISNVHKKIVPEGQLFSGASADWSNGCPLNPGHKLSAQKFAMLCCNVAVSFCWNEPIYCMNYGRRRCFQSIRFVSSISWTILFYQFQNI